MADHSSPSVKRSKPMRIGCMPKIERMEYRCFHCKQVFTDDALARQHFGKHTTDLPLCLEYVQKGMGGGVHDAYIRVRKDEYYRLVAGFQCAQPQQNPKKERHE